MTEQHHHRRDPAKYVQRDDVLAALRACGHPLTRSQELRGSISRLGVGRARKLSAARSTGACALLIARRSSAEGFHVSAQRALRISPAPSAAHQLHTHGYRDQGAEGNQQA
ncbi:hypothetical protein [Tsuneonella rigui]|uniref:hypothetical protein n=1 Tax=Tsuneonella rigui TaxID=1708790 RepID=UPI000F7F2320|nr:hypothetical protein [Tsuneonella rigui]